MNIVFTGKVELQGEHITRKELIQMVEMFGHVVGTSVSRATDFVVCSAQDFKNRQGIKLQAADRLGIPSITVPELIKRIREV